MQLASISLLVSVSSWLTLCRARENSRLFYYETLSEIAVTTRAKRASPSRATLVKELQFQALRRNFHLSLTSGSPVLAQGFRARMIHGDGSSTRFAIDQSKLFTGHLVNSEQSVVSAHLEDELWHIHILERGEAYAVEPAWRLLADGENPYNDTMVTYRLSDVKDLPPNYRFCDASPEQNATGMPKKPAGKAPGIETPGRANEKSFRSARQKRKVKDVKNTCLMHLVGDAKFYETRCKRNHIICSSLMISILQITDELYRNAKFENNLGVYRKGIGLQVGEITLFTEYTAARDKQQFRHYNEKVEFEAPEKLDSFAYYIPKESAKHYCLHHLFSDYADSTGILGRAYTTVLCHRGQPAYNTGISSGTNNVGDLLPSIMATNVFSHELSHNFGSNHDPDTTECAPTEEVGGKYLMWPYAQEGYRPNNFVFSPCTRRQIGRQVPAKCFVERSKLSEFCGNGIVDSGEECDTGSSGLLKEDQCCTSECLLREGATCSDKNHECCQDCGTAPNGTLCRAGYRYSCIRDAYCTGTSTVCPEGKTMPDGEVCGDNFVCSEGKCVGPCKQATNALTDGRVLMPCSCIQNVSEQCMYCCFDATRPGGPGECRPVISKTKPDGAPCHDGLCEGGRCKKHVILNAIKLENYIQFVQKSSLAQFMRRNIILVVVVLSLLMWVPPSVIISYFDKREYEEREGQLEAKRHIVEMEDLRRRHALEAWRLSSTRLTEEDSQFSFIQSSEGSDVAQKTVETDAISIEVEPESLTEIRVSESATDSVENEILVKVFPVAEPEDC